VKVVASADPAQIVLRPGGHVVPSRIGAFLASWSASPEHAAAHKQASEERTI
jgi:hypothetical protein